MPSRDKSKLSLGRINGDSSGSVSRRNTPSSGGSRRVDTPGEGGKGGLQCLRGPTTCGQGSRRTGSSRVAPWRHQHHLRRRARLPPTALSATAQHWCYLQGLRSNTQDLSLLTEYVSDNKTPSKKPIRFTRSTQSKKPWPSPQMHGRQGGPRSWTLFL